MPAKSYYKRPHRVRAIQYWDNKQEVIDFIGDPETDIIIGGHVVGHYLVDVGGEFIWMFEAVFNAIYQENKSAG